jgi:hypothetical protein
VEGPARLSFIGVKPMEQAERNSETRDSSIRIMWKIMEN